ncbi:hypothetical protein [Wolbachia endosymbiont (group A) of Rhorus exstirpatorius]|uniref:hypothetical protein n=1 Tax=Wolbachia endosymbiont (group A) of Rhorus exstirpatorius TaxID=3066213 RepID=UPI00333F72D9
MTAVLRHTAAVSHPLTRSGILDLYRDDGCQASLSSQCPDTGMALLHRSSEKNWQLLTKFIINSHLTVEEKICHKK